MTKVDPGSSLLLKGVVGSQAFGLANEHSDYDYQGIFVAPTASLLGLESKVQESYSYKDPDTTYHEVGKYCRLALKCNPTVLDLLWLEHYNVRTELGTELVNLRNNFLSTKYVRDAYFGYATSQYGKLLKDERPEKRAKNARHFYRLVYQGWQLYATGTYSVDLGDMAGLTKHFGEIVGVQQEVHHAKELLDSYKEKFDSVKSPLPAEPNKEPINEWLLKVRHEFYTKETAKAGNVQQGYSDIYAAGAMGKSKTWP